MTGFCWVIAPNEASVSIISARTVGEQAVFVCAVTTVSLPLTLIFLVYSCFVRLVQFH